MPTESHNDDDLLKQPLPSMDIPLLREERRSHRIRQSLIFIFAGLIGGVTIWGLSTLDIQFSFSETLEKESEQILEDPRHAPIVEINGETKTSPSPTNPEHTNTHNDSTLNDSAQQDLTQVDHTLNLQNHIGTRSHIPSQQDTFSSNGSAMDERAKSKASFQRPLSTNTSSEVQQQKNVLTKTHVSDSHSPSISRKSSHTSHQFGDSGSFRAALQKAGLSNHECQELEHSLSKVMSFRRCRADDRMEIYRDAMGKLEKFEYHFDEINFVRAHRVENGSYSAKKMEASMEQKTLSYAGQVSDSLGKSILLSGLGHSVVNVFLEVFAGHIDFSRDVREGDRFAIVIDEKYLNGEKKGYGKAHALSYQGSKAGNKTAFWYESKKARPAYYDETGRELQGGWMKYPLRYDKISSPFDPKRRHPILKKIIPHHGVDFAASTGTPVRSCAKGTVTFAGYKGPNGNLVIVDHGSGYTSHYAHLHRITRGIKKGTQVKQGRLLGVVGTTGRSTGPHLHFGLKKRGRWIDPLTELNNKGRPLPRAELSKFQKKIRALKKKLDTRKETG